jgi:hypothetical protein
MPADEVGPDRQFLPATYEHGELDGECPTGAG